MLSDLSIGGNTNRAPKLWNKLSCEIRSQGFRAKIVVILLWNFLCGFQIGQGLFLDQKRYLTYFGAYAVRVGHRRYVRCYINLSVIHWRKTYDVALMYLCVAGEIV
jgi:hypothetical protein